MTNNAVSEDWALVDGFGKIVSLHSGHESAYAGRLGKHLDMVLLRKPHSVGDTIEYADAGVEL